MARAETSCPASGRAQLLRDTPEQLLPCATSPDATARVWGAHALAATGQFSEAARLLAEAAAHEPSSAVKSVLLLSAAYDEARAGDPRAGLRRLGGVKASRPWLQTQVAAARADLSLLVGAWSDAERAANEALRRDPPTPDTLYLLLARAAAGRGSQSAFTSALMKLEVDYPGSEATRAAERLATEELKLPTLSTSDYAERWRHWIAQGGAQAVADECLPTLSSIPASAGVARFQCGAALATAHNAAAMTVMKEAADALAGQPLQSRALLSYARMQGKGNNAEAVAAVCPLIKNADDAAECTFLVGFLYQQIGQREKAEAAFARVQKQFPHSARAHDAAWFLAFDAFRNDRAHAVERFDAMLKGALSGAERVQALYWRGRSRSAGEAEQARADWNQVLQLDPFGYYGWLAASRLGLESAPASSETCGKAESVARVSVPAPAGDAARLLALGFTHDAALEIRSALPRSRSDALRWADFLADAGLFERIVTLGVSFGGQGGPWPISDERRPIVQAAFPRAFPSALAGAPAGVDRCLLLSLMRRESRFDPDAISQAQARGLMQLLPTTAAQVAKEFGQEPPTADHLHDPDVNVRVAAQYVQRLMERFGNPLLVAAAYNGGPRSVAKWTQEMAGAELDEWVERIPFRETRNYVKAVGGAYAAYALIYGGKRPPISWEPLKAAGPGIDY